MSKVWFVTGSSRGLGRALVEVALEAGDCVAATARNPARLQDLLDTYGDALLPLRLDVTDYDAAARVVAQARETFGRIDVVVNNAGYSDLGSFEDTTIASFRTQIDVHGRIRGCAKKCARNPARITHELPSHPVGSRPTRTKSLHLPTIFRVLLRARGCLAFG